MSAAARKTRWRSAGGACDQAPKAASAASTARRASARVPAGTVATTSPEYGSRSSKVAPPLAPVHSPPMNCRYSVVVIRDLPVPRATSTTRILPRATVPPMGTRRRRRIDAVLLAGVVLLVGVLAGVAAVAGRTERVAGLWASARVAGDGAARIVEVIDYDFGSRQRHGIYRDVPGLDPADPVQVSSPTAPAQVEATGTAQQTRLRIGDPERTVTGRHRYTIGYRLGGVGGPDQRLAWDAVGTSWPVGIARAELHLAAPYRLERVTCFHGDAGSAAPCRVDQPEPGHLVATVEGLDAGEGVTVYASAGTGLPAAPALPAPPPPPADPGTGPYPPALVALATALAGALATSWWVRRAGRERVVSGGAAEAAFGADGNPPVRLVDAADLAGLATVEFAPPPELTPAQGGVLLAEAVRPEHKVAWLIGAAVDGHLELEGDGDQVTLVRLPRRDGAASYLLDSAFEGRDRLTLGAYDEDFSLAWGSLGRELSAWQKSSGLWDPAGDHRQVRSRILGVAAGVAGAVLTAQGAVWASQSGPAWLALVALGALLAGSGVAAAVRAWELRVRTPAGSGLWLRTESFRRFLAGSEAHHAEEAAKRGHLREYTAWAVAVGELDRWSRAVAASSAAAADPVAARVPLLAPGLLVGSSGSSTPPSSGGSGGGGGGVGGGAGGGGGGSW